MPMLQQVLERARAGRAEAEAELFDLLSIPSVSALPEHRGDLRPARHWFAEGGPPVNLRFLIEGEEESGGRSLPELVRTSAGELATDYLLIADGSFLAPGLPALVTGLRGMLYTEVDVVG